MQNRKPQQKFSLYIFLTFLCTFVFIFVLSQQRQQGPKDEVATRASKLLRDVTFPFTELLDPGNKSDTDYWNSYHPSFTCPAKSLIRIGKSGDGGKWTCGAENLARRRDTPCVLYSFGVSGDSSFEADMLSTTPCDLWAYDPTVDKIANPLRPSNLRVHFEKLGIAGKDAGDKKTLKTFMDNNGHEWIDVLKVDVEGFEYEMLDNILETFDQLPFGQLFLEFHLMKKPEHYRRIQSLIERLEMKGMRMFYKENNPLWLPGCEFSLINTKSLGLFLSMEDIEIISRRFV